MRRQPAALIVVIAVGVAALVSLIGPPPRARADGVVWTDETLDAALTRAAESGSRVFVKFEAEWCTYCRQLEEEVLDTPEGAALTEGMVAVRIDFDDPQNREHVERYAVLSLPTVLVLTPDGHQAGRLDGYDSRDGWLEEAREAVVADDPIPDLRARVAANPDDERLRARLAEELLVRGYPEEGQAMLERLAFTDGALAAEALFLLGRFHHRVRRNPELARHYWRELATRFPAHEYAAGALFWYARAEHELGRSDRGLAVLEDHARRAGDVDALLLLVSFVERYEVAVDRAALADRLEARLAEIDDPEARAEAEESVAALR